MKHTAIDHEFVEFMPSELREGTLYVSVQFATAVHKCACGCGNKVVTPFSPADWQLFFDGDTVSLTPSIGNWQFPCRSHYWIRSNRVRWAEDWTPEQVAAGRLREARDHERYFAGRQSPSRTADQMDAEVQPERRPGKKLIARLLHWLGLKSD